MTSPTKSSHTSRLLAQIAELTTQRDQLITDLLPLMPADVLASAQRDDSSEVESTKSDKEASPFTFLATPSNSTATETSALPDEAGSPTPTPSIAHVTLTDATRAAVLAHAEHTVKQHISRLHAYNGIRDIGQNVMGLLAEQRGVRVVQVMAECGVGEGD